MSQTKSADQRQGGCQCRRVRYAAPAEPIVILVCHCTECRRQSASAFGLSFVVARERFRLLQGEPRFWWRRTASGRRLDCAFCPDCGCRLWHQSSGFPNTLNIKGGSLDEPLDLSTATHIWVSSKLPGIVIPKGAIAFPEEPPKTRV
jgi:hypothetical protein